MSLDIWLEKGLKDTKCSLCNKKIDNINYKYCPWCGNQFNDEIHNQNYTHNVIPMWKLANVYDALYMSDGKMVDEIIEDLRYGINHMINNPKQYEKLNPTNDWGDYKTALSWLIEFYNACLKNPKAKIGISK